eukprot:SAG31_NODE_349_length_17243_cov_7.408248_5_plen_47_part_00
MHSDHPSHWPSSEGSDRSGVNINGCNYKVGTPNMFAVSENGLKKME